MLEVLEQENKMNREAILLSLYESYTLMGALIAEDAPRKIKSGEIRKGRGPGTFTDQPLHLTPGPGERRASPEEIRRRIRRNLQMQQGGKRNDDSDPKQTAIDRLHRRAGGKGKRARKARRRLNRLAKRDDGSQD